MTEHWQPPQISIQHLQQPGYGHRTSPRMTVPARQLLIIYQVLYDLVNGEAARNEWLRLLNASLPHGTRPLSMQTLRLHHYSQEFYWIAHYYATHLSNNPSEYRLTFANRFIQENLPSLSWLRSLPTAIKHLTGQLRYATISPLEWEQVGFRSLKVRWYTDQALKHIAIEYQEIYLQTTIPLIATIFQETPHLLQRQHTLFHQSETVDNNHSYLEWTVAWQEDITTKTYVGLGLGIFASLVIMVAIILGASYLQWLVLVPTLIGASWALVLRLRQYAGHQEYQRHETKQHINEQLNNLESLNQLDRELNRALSLDRVLALWFDWAIRLTHANAGSIVLLNTEQNKMQLAESYGYDRDLDQYHAANWNIGIIGRSIRTGASFYVPDVTEDTDYVALSSTTRSQLTIPVVRGRQMVAILTLEKDTRNGFSISERVRIARLCDRASFALINAVLLQQTEQERRRLSTLMANITDVVIATDQHGRLTLLNPAAMKTFGLEADVDYHHQDFLTIFDNIPLVETFRQGIAADGYAHREIEINSTAFEANMIPVEHIGYLLVLHNITPFKELDNLKNDLVATVSHDLKNPLSAIKGYLDLIDLTIYLDGSARTYMDKSLQLIDDMSQLIEGLLSVARLESGLLPNYQPIELAKLLAQTLDRHRLELNSKQMSLNADIPSDLPPIHGDSHHITQIVHNLLSNAIKYSPPDSDIRLSVRPNGERIFVSVADTGIGIPEEAIPTLFDKFTRVRDNRSVGIDGTGLGLYIVKKLVEAQDGEISVQSKYGEGSTFTFTLPIKSD